MGGRGKEGLCFSGPKSESLAYWHTRFLYPPVWAIIVNIEYETGAGFGFSVVFLVIHVIFSGLIFVKFCFSKAISYRTVTKSDGWGRVGN